MHKKKNIRQLVFIAFLATPYYVYARTEDPSLWARFTAQVATWAEWFGRPIESPEITEKRAQLAQLQKVLTNKENEKKNIIYLQGIQALSEAEAQGALKKLDQEVNEITLKISSLKRELGIPEHEPSQSQQVAPGIQMPTQTGAYLEGKKDLEKEQVLVRAAQSNHQVKKQKKQRKTQEYVIVPVSSSQPQQWLSEDELQGKGLLAAQQQTGTHTSALVDRKKDISEQPLHQASGTTTSANTSTTAIIQDKHEDSGYHIALECEPGSPQYYLELPKKAQEAPACSGRWLSEEELRKKGLLDVPQQASTHTSATSAAIMTDSKHQAVQSADTELEREPGSPHYYSELQKVKETPVPAPATTASPIAARDEPREMWF